MPRPLHPIELARDQMIKTELGRLRWTIINHDDQYRPNQYRLIHPHGYYLGPGDLQAMAKEARRLAALPPPRPPSTGPKAPVGRRPRQSLVTLRRCVACTALIWEKNARVHLADARHFPLDKVQAMDHDRVMSYFEVPADVADDGTGDI